MQEMWDQEAIEVSHGALALVMYSCGPRPGGFDVDTPASVAQVFSLSHNFALKLLLAAIGQ
jgi:hypothetical protein